MIERRDLRGPSSGWEIIGIDPVWLFRWSHTRSPQFLHQLSNVGIPADRRDFELMRRILRSYKAGSALSPDADAYYRRLLMQFKATGQTTFTAGDISNFV